MLSQATAGEEYLADLPPFNDPSDPKGVTLHAEPRLPDGLALADLGAGFGRIAGRPNKPGQYSFAIVANDASGASARMSTQLAVAEPASPAPTPAPQLQAPTQPPEQNPVVAAIAPTDKAAAYLQDFRGGPCFLARSLGDGGSKPVILGIGANRATFERFYAGFNREVGVEPTLTVRLIAASQCPAVDLISANASNEADAPKIALASYDVDRSRPLAGSVSNLAGRNLAVLVVTTDGGVHRIDARPSADGASATFSAPVVGEAGPKDMMQVIVAIASSKPLPSLVDFKSGAAGAILPRVRADLAAAGGSLVTDFFRFVN